MSEPLPAPVTLEAVMFAPAFIALCEPDGASSTEGVALPAKKGTKGYTKADIFKAAKT